MSLVGVVACWLMWPSKIEERRSETISSETGDEETFGLFNFPHEYAKMPSKSERRRQQVSTSDLIKKAEEERERGEDAKAHDLLLIAFEREPENEELLKLINELVTPQLLGEPVIITITESRIEMPVFSTRVLGDESKSYSE